MKKTWLYVIAIFAVLVAVVWYFFTQSSIGTNGVATGTNVFTGRIVGTALAAGSYNDVPMLSDQGCTTDPRTGLSNCTTSFTTKSGTVYYFNYEHNMMMQPCLSIGDKANVQVSGDGRATIERTYWAGGGA